MKDSCKTLRTTTKGSGSPGRPGRRSALRLGAGLVLPAAALFLGIAPARAQAWGTVTQTARIVFGYPGDGFGSSLATVGDLDGDGAPDLVVGAPGVDGGGIDRGAIYLLIRLVPIYTAVRIGSEHPALATLTDGDRFGAAVANLGDLDGDGAIDLAVGAPGDDTAGPDAGAVWLLFMNGDGTLRETRKLTSGVTGPGFTLGAGDEFGAAVAGVGDVNLDGVPDVSIGAPGTDDGGPDRGAVWTFLLNPDGSYQHRLKISDTEGSLSPPPPDNILSDGDRFGASVAGPGDLNSDYYVDLLVGAPGDDDGGIDRGAVWVVKIWGNGQVRLAQKISESAGAFGAGLADGDGLGGCVGLPGDVDGDGSLDIIAGAPGDDDGLLGSGAVWITFLDDLEQVAGKQAISATAGGFTPPEPLGYHDRFGAAAAGVGDVDGDGLSEIAVGAPGHGEAGPDAGAVFLLTLVRSAPVCGDRIVDPEEECDDGFLNGNSRPCLADCTRARCGDGFVDWTREECDDGTGNSDTTPDACRVDCSAPRCGDGVLDPGNSEECDDGADNSDEVPGACRTDCSLRPETVVFQHEGSLGPGYENWLLDAGTAGPLSYGAVSDTAYGSQAWAIYDDSTAAGSILWYRRVPSPAQIAVARSAGWTLRTRARVVNAPDPLDLSILFEYADGARRWAMGLAADAAGNPVALLWDGGGTSSGMQAAVPGPGYHEYELIHDPAAGSARLLVDGTELLSGYAGFAYAMAPRVIWGAGQSTGTGRAHYGLVQWGLNTTCGNDRLDFAESCDDGGVENGDGCDAACAPEPGWACASFNGASYCGEVCGDGQIAGVEECEDGNTASGDGCGPTCQIEGPGAVLSHDLIVASALGGDLYSSGESFGMAMTALGDVDGDGVGDLAASTRGHRKTTLPDGTDVYDFHMGAVWILFMNADNTVRARTKIFDGQGGLGDVLDAWDQFGESLAPLGDLDGDGVPDLAAGARGDDDAGADAGAVWVLFLNRDGTVKSYTKISEGTAGFDDPAVALERFGAEIAGLGDPDRDGAPDLVAAGWPPGAVDNIGAGHLYVLHLEPDGTVRDYDRIDHLGTPIGNGDQMPVEFFGWQLATVGDLDGDGMPEVAVGVQESVPALPDGAVWIYFLNSDFTVRSITKVNAASGGFVPDYHGDDFDFFGHSLAGVGDLDGDGLPDLAVGAMGADVRAANDGTAWIWFLDADGTVRQQRAINFREGGLSIPFAEDYSFATGLAGLPDTDGDGVSELAVGAFQGGGSPTQQGAILILHLAGSPAACGDGALDPGEECDDGALAAGDGCAATCEIEDFAEIFGTAQGGTVTVSVNGLSAGVATTAGQDTTEVAAALAAALESLPALAAMQVSVAASGPRVTTTGVVTAVDITDFGMTNCAAPPSPGISTAGSNTCPAATTTLSTGAFAGHLWFFGRSPIPAALGSSYEAQVGGEYRVRATDDAGCQGFSAPATVTVGLCQGTEVSPAGAFFPLRIEPSAASATGYYIYFQKVDDVDGYNLYAGTPGSWYSHGGAAANVCDLAVTDLGTGEMRAEIDVGAGSAYYLVTAFGGGVEGQAGRASAGTPIDPAQSTCLP